MRDVVREPLLEIEAEPLSLDMLLNKFEPRRKLLPRRTARKPEPGSAEVSRKVEVVVQAGVDLPVRSGPGGGAVDVAADGAGGPAAGGQAGSGG